MLRVQDYTLYLHLQERADLETLHQRLGPSPLPTSTNADDFLQQWDWENKLDPAPVCTHCCMKSFAFPCAATRSQHGPFDPFCLRSSSDGTTTLPAFLHLSFSAALVCAL